jgi:hypothetical protein
MNWTALFGAISSVCNLVAGWVKPSPKVEPEAVDAQVARAGTQAGASAYSAGKRAKGATLT